MNVSQLINTEYFFYYLIIVNVIAAIWYGVDYYRYTHWTGRANPKFLGVLLPIIGGALGTVITVGICDRKSKVGKRNIGWWVFFIVMLILWIVAVAWIMGPTPSVQKILDAMLNTPSIFLMYLGVINIVTLILFGIDKWKAVHDRWRIKVVTLFLFVAIGGSVGGLLGMYIFRHKTKQPAFRFGVPAILITWIVVYIYITSVGIG